jgi:programmed cell death protein 5
MRNRILACVLVQSARARLSNLALVKPEKRKAVENYFIQMARYGQVSGKKSLKKSANKQKTVVKFNKGKIMDSDECDNY